MFSKNGNYRIALIVAVISILALLVTAVVTLSVVGSASRSTPAITTLVGIFVPVIGVLVALIQTEKIDHKTDAIDRKVNGHITRLTEAAINAGVKPEDLPPPPEDLQRPEGKT